MRRTITSWTAVGTGGLVLALALTACSSGEAADGDDARADGKAASTEQAYANGAPVTATDDAVWDFSSPNALPPRASLTFEVDDDLVQVATDYADRRVWDRIVATGVVLDDPRKCAVRLDFTPAPGTDIDALASASVADYERLGSDEDHAYAGVLGYPYPDEELAVGELDPSDWEGEHSARLWMSSDHRSLTKVVDCAASSYDDAATVDVRFPSATEDGTDLEQDLASADVSVMKNGDVTVTESSVDDWVRDTNGTWIAD